MGSGHPAGVSGCSSCVESLHFWKGGSEIYCRVSSKVDTRRASQRRSQNNESRVTTTLNCELRYDLLTSVVRASVSMVKLQNVCANFVIICFLKLQKMTEKLTQNLVMTLGIPSLTNSVAGCKLFIELSAVFVKMDFHNVIAKSHVNFLVTVLFNIKELSVSK